VPESLDELVLWATEKAPDERPRDAQQMLDRLREIEKELRISPVVSTTAAIAGIPALDEEGDSGELTKVLPAAITSPTVAVEEVDNATRLRRKSRSRRARGAWAVTLVLLAAALTGAAGWWFGSGPGSLVAVPDVTGKDFAAAKALLADSALSAKQGEAYDLDVEKGLAIGADPKVGALIDKDTVVTVIVSRGPRPQTLEALAGRTADAAGGLIAEKKLKVAAESVEVFDGRIADGTVVAATLIKRSDGKTADCSQGCKAFEGDSVRLTVSVGAVPKVADLSVEDATKALNEKRLQVATKQDSKFDDKIAKGKVIGLAKYEGALHPNDTVTLVVSKGPQPIAVPHVVGKTVHEAFDALQRAGFTPLTSLEGNPLWDFFTVASVDPGEGTMQLPGTKVKIISSGF